MLLTKEVDVKPNSNTIKWYEDKGYFIPKIKDIKNIDRVKRGTKIKVNVNDLHDGSGVFVNIQCDGCGEILTNIEWRRYKECFRKNGKYYCNECAKRVLNVYEKAVITKLKKSKSFYEWCYSNLSEEEADKIILRWDHKLNVKDGKILTPQDIGFSSNNGINKKGFWFKCLDHPEHGSELKNINSFTSGIGSITCNQCNAIEITHPEILKFLVNKEDAKYSIGQHKKILAKCLNCGYEKEIIIGNLNNQGFSCPRCSDGISYPEKFMFNVLNQIKIKFKPQLTRTTFEWCDKYKYDFYINKENCIIETHGEQHYEGKIGNWGSLSYIQQNDKNKEQLAFEQGIENYIVIDCRKSEMTWIKASILNSRLPQLLNFKEEDIDWLKCHEYACKSLVKTVCNLWNSGIKKISIIAKKLKLNVETVRKYLKQGDKLGWCNYSSKR